MLHGRLLVVQIVTTARLLAALSFASIALIPEARTLAFGFYLAAIATDIVDGYLARRLGCATRFGEHYDGFADKALDTVSTLYVAVQGASIVACALILIRHILTLTVRAATSAVDVGSRTVGALNGAPIRLITLMALAMPTATWLYPYVWLAAGLSTLTAAREIWLHRRALQTLLLERRKSKSTEQI